MALEAGPAAEDQRVRSLAVSPDLRHVAGIVEIVDGRIEPSTALRVWEISTGKMLHEIEATFGGWGLRYSPSGEYLVCSMTFVRYRDLPEATVEKVNFVALDVAAGYVGVWHQEAILPLTGELDTVAFTADGRFLVASPWVWPISRSAIARESFMLSTSGLHFAAAPVAERPSFIALLEYQGEGAHVVEFWDLEARERGETFELPGRWAVGARMLSPTAGGDIVVLLEHYDLVRDGGAIMVLDPISSTIQRWAMPRGLGRMTSAYLIPSDYRLLLSGWPRAFDFGVSLVLDTTTGRARRRSRLSRPITMAFDHGGEVVVFSDDDDDEVTVAWLR